MTEEIIIAGFGGQGVLSMGKILAYSGIMQDQEVSWMPSYGPEMRGGTANVTVILSDDRISSPYLKIFDTAIILNQQSMDKFEESVKPGGVLLYDPNGFQLIQQELILKYIKLKVTDCATEMGNKKIFNMVILGAFLKVKPIVKLDNVIEGLKKSLPERYHNLIPLNKEAITKGMQNIFLFKVENQLTGL